jgi:hypothetical protein
VARGFAAEADMTPQHPGFALMAWQDRPDLRRMKDRLVLRATDDRRGDDDDEQSRGHAGGQRSQSAPLFGGRRKVQDGFAGDRVDLTTARLDGSVLGCPSRCSTNWLWMSPQR